MVCSCQVVRNAAEALGYLGPAAGEALAPLMTLLDPASERPSRVRHNAALCVPTFADAMLF